MRVLIHSLVLLAILAAAGPAPVRADTVSGDVVTIDATDPAAVRVEHKLTWRAGANRAAGTEVVFHLARGIDVTSVSSGGASLGVKGAPVASSTLRKWTVELAAPLDPTGTRDFVVQTVIRAEDVPGIAVDARGGVLAPGSGWFPAPTVETDELVAHRTAFRLPAGVVGVAAGIGTGGVWGSEDAVRPFAAWGAWTRSEFRRGDLECVAYRDAAASGDLPVPSRLEDLVYALDTGLGEPAGSGPWTFVDVGRGILAGGARTVLWDEGAASSAGPLFARDLAGALAASYWNDAMRFSGPLAALFARSFPAYLGDIAAITLDESDQRYHVRARLVGPRLEEFVRHRKDDRTLSGILPSDPDAQRTLATRGVLVAHMMDASARSGAYFMAFLRSLRDKYAGANVDHAVFRHELRSRFGARMKYIDQYLDTTDVPDFVLGTHEVVQAKIGARRLKVQVRNEGSAPDIARVTALSGNGVEMFTAEIAIGPGEERAVLFGRPERIARVEVDTSKRGLQQSLESEVIDLQVADAQAEVRPSFDMSRANHDMVRVTGMDLDLEGVSIRGFEGHAAWYETYHGPTGLLLMGNATVVVQPTPPHAESFRKAMGKESLEFETPAMWVRFPVADWKQVRDQLMNAEHGEGEPAESKQEFMFTHSFPTGFAEGLQAQVPPPGGALVVLSLGGVERRAFLRDPRADGKVYARFWDQLRGETLWEDTR